MKLCDISLSQYVEFLNKYGTELGKITDEYVGLITDAFIYYSYFTGIQKPEKECEDYLINALNWYNGFIYNPKIETYLVDAYNIFDSSFSIQPIIKDSEKLSKKDWDIINQVSMIYAEYLDGNNEALYLLCAAYLRQINEPFNITDAGIDLMKRLPLDIALCVLTYILESLNSYGEQFK